MPDPSPPVPPEPARPQRRRALRVAPWIVVPVLALCGVAYWNAQRVAEATLARHRAKFEQERRDLPLRAKSRPALREPIARGTAEEVADEFVRAVERVPEQDRKGLWGFASEESEAASPEEQDRILAAHPEPLEILSRILHVPSTSSGAFEDDPTEAVVASRQLGGRWAFAHLRRLVTRTGVADRARTLRLVADLVTFGADFERRGTWASLLVGRAFEELALGQLPALFAIAPLRREDALALATVLDALEADRPPLSEVVDYERAKLRGLFSVETMDIDVGARDVGWRHLWSGRIYRAEAMEVLDAGMDRLLEVLKSVQLDPRRAIESANRLGDEGGNELGRMGLVFWGITLRRTIQRDAVWRVGRTALAVAVYTSEHGAPPPSLAALVPTQLPVVPIDPWDGKPLRYEAGPPARIWSIGRDGKDDGGKPLLDPDDESQPGDFAITVKPAR